MNEINWLLIYPKYVNSKRAPKKFQRLPSLIPWFDSMEDNLWLTLEWIIRDNRIDEIRLCPEPVLNRIKNNWYKAEYDEGRFLHICYPQDFLNFRMQYESFYCHLKTLDTTNILMVENLRNNARRKLWSIWECTGRDGHYYYNKKTFEPKLRWDNKCSLCSEPLPKSLQMWVKLQHSRLRDAR